MNLGRFIVKRLIVAVTCLVALMFVAGAGAQAAAPGRSDSGQKITARGGGGCFKFCSYRNKVVRCRHKDMFGGLHCIATVPVCRCVSKTVCPPPQCRQVCLRPRCVKVRVCR